MSVVEKETLDEIVKRIDEKLDMIIQQTTKTNGRVSKLENWMNYVKGAFLIVGIAIGYLFK